MKKYIKVYMIENRWYFHDTEGRTELEWARYRNDIEVIEALQDYTLLTIEHGKDISIYWMYREVK